MMNQDYYISNIKYFFFSFNNNNKSSQMKQVYVAIITFFVLNISPLTEAFAWGTTGHRVIAEVAERNLNRKTKNRLFLLIGKQKLAYYANWPDQLKSDTTDKWKHTTSNWHYINLTPNLSRSTFEDSVRNYKKESVYDRIPYVQQKLRDHSLSNKERIDYLAFLVHFMGDMHQPMHVGRYADLGGNKITLNWFGHPTNLHKVWDTDLVDFQKWSYTEYATVIDVVSINEKKQIMSGNRLDWLFESYTLANDIYAHAAVGDNLSYSYPYKYSDKMNLQLLRAGLRLARILNETL